jgi:hypothetical protein
VHDLEHVGDHDLAGGIGLLSEIVGVHT